MGINAIVDAIGDGRGEDSTCLFILLSPGPDTVDWSGVYLFVIDFLDDGRARIGTCNETKDAVEA
jgi:hypothetical protein